MFWCGLESDVVAEEGGGGYIAAAPWHCRTVIEADLWVFVSVCRRQTDPNTFRLELLQATGGFTHTVVIVTRVYCVKLVLPLKGFVYIQHPALFCRRFSTVLQPSKPWWTLMSQTRELVYHSKISSVVSSRNLPTPPHPHTHTDDLHRKVSLFAIVA